MTEDGRGGGKGGEADEVDLRADGEDNMPGEWEQTIYELDAGCPEFAWNRFSFTPALAQYAENHYFKSIQINTSVYCKH